MNILKRWASFLYDVHLESSSSDQNEELHVLLSSGQLQLCTANAIYSYGDRYDNYLRAFKKLNIGQKNIDSVLILGLGLASIPYMLERRFGLSTHYTAVEIDEEVVRLAQKYTTGHMKSRLEVFITDAFTFVSQSQEKFDLVCMDVFVDDIIPAKFQSTGFLNDLSNLISKDGWLLYNRLARTKNDLKATQQFYNGPFKEVFPEGNYLEVRGNWMLLNKSPQSL